MLLSRGCVPRGRKPGHCSSPLSALACSCRLCRLPLPGRGNRAAAPAPSATALGQRRGAVGRPEGAAPCSLPPALLSRAAEGQQLCAKISLLMKPARALHFLFALATLHSRHFDGKLMTTMSSTMTLTQGPGLERSLSSWPWLCSLSPRAVLGSRSLSALTSPEGG